MLACGASTAYRSATKSDGQRPAGGDFGGSVRHRGLRVSTAAGSQRSVLDGAIRRRGHASDVGRIAGVAYG